MREIRMKVEVSYQAKDETSLEEAKELILELIESNGELTVEAWENPHPLYKSVGSLMVERTEAQVTPHEEEAQVRSLSN